MKFWISPIVLMLSVLTLVAQDVNLFTLPNQTATFLRMPARGATTDIDAVYYNPAGLTKLNDGFHLSLNNQMLRQKSTLTSDYQYLPGGSGEYEGVAKAYFFPTILAAFKKNRFAVSGGFIMAAGAGGATYDNLPSAEQGIYDIIPALNISLLDELNANHTTKLGYDPGYNNLTDMSFNFSSDGVGYYPGGQVGFSYKISDLISVAAAGRYLTSVVRAEGQATDIMVNAPDHGGWQKPADYLDYLSNLPEMSSGQSRLLSITSAVYTQLGKDRYINVIQRGKGFTPILSLHSTPTDKLEVGLKYEFNTKVELTTEVIDGKDGGLVGYDEDKKNGVNQYTDGEVVRSDLPAFISGGVNYELTPKLIGAIGGRYMFDKNANYNGREDGIKSNYFEIEMAAEYELKENVLLSGGYTYARPTVTDEYQSEVDFRVPSHTFGIGGQYALNEDVKVNLGLMYTKFNSTSSEYCRTIGGAVMPFNFPPDRDPDPEPYNLGFEKDALLFAIGVDFELSNKENRN